MIPAWSALNAFVDAALTVGWALGVVWLVGLAFLPWLLRVGRRG